MQVTSTKGCMAAALTRPVAWARSLCVLVVGLASLTLTAPVAAQVQRTMVNTGFEQPIMDTTPNSAPRAEGVCWRAVVDTAVPGWLTTHPVWTAPAAVTVTCQNTPIPGNSTTGRFLEFWPNNGVDNFTNASLLSRAGNQFVELNAFVASRLRQDICLLNDEAVGWSVSHMGRRSNTVADVLEFRIGATPVARMSTSANGSI